MGNIIARPWTSQGRKYIHNFAYETLEAALRAVKVVRKHMSAGESICHLPSTTVIA